MSSMHYKLVQIQTFSNSPRNINKRSLIEEQLICERTRVFHFSFYMTNMLNALTTMSKDFWDPIF